MTTHPFTTNYLHEEKVMKLWLLTRTDRGERGWAYEEYDSAVVAANTEDEARAIHPDEEITCVSHDFWTTPEDIIVKYLGEAKPDTKSGVICASFNAG